MTGGEEPGTVEAPPPLPTTRNPLRRMYRWILSWAHHPMGTWALGVFAFLDSSVFPIPPLYLQIALSVERPRRSWWYAAVNTVSSVAGAALGYLIGHALYETVGSWIIRAYGLEESFAWFGREFGENAFVFILIYSFWPIPFKVITIGSGVYSGQVGLATLLIASTLGRSTRFFLIAAACFFLGRRAGELIERHFNWLTLATGVLVLAAVLVLRFGLR